MTEIKRILVPFVSKYGIKAYTMFHSIITGIRQILDEIVLIVYFKDKPAKLNLPCLLK